MAPAPTKSCGSGRSGSDSPAQLWITRSQQLSYSTIFYKYSAFTCICCANCKVNYNVLEKRELFALLMQNRNFYVFLLDVIGFRVVWVVNIRRDISVLN